MKGPLCISSTDVQFVTFVTFSTASVGTPATPPSSKIAAIPTPEERNEVNAKIFSNGLHSAIKFWFVDLIN